MKRIYLFICIYLLAWGCSKKNSSQSKLIENTRAFTEISKEQLLEIINSPTELLSIEIGPGAEPICNNCTYIESIVRDPLKSKVLSNVDNSSAKRIIQQNVFDDWQGFSENSVSRAIAKSFPWYGVSEEYLRDNNLFIPLKKYMAINGIFFEVMNVLGTYKKHHHSALSKHIELAKGSNFQAVKTYKIKIEEVVSTPIYWYVVVYKKGPDIH